MIIHKIKSYFGLSDREDIINSTISQIIDGKKTAACTFKDLYTPKEIDQILKTKEEFVTIIDALGQPRCNIKIIDVFETSYGNPDQRLLDGEGDNCTLEKFQEYYSSIWDSILKDLPLTDDTILIVEIFEYIPD